MIKTKTKTNEPITAIELYKQLDIPHIFTSISVSNGAKFPKWINPKNPPADYPMGLKDLPYHLWTRGQIKQFNKWVIKNHKNELTDFIGIPNLANYVVIDIDSKDEVEKLKHTDLLDCFHTKSIRKRLPHILVKVKDENFLSKDVSKILGKSKGRDIDMITNVIYEKIDGEVFGDRVAEMTLQEIGKYIFNDEKLIVMKEGIILQRENGLKKKKIDFNSNQKFNPKKNKNNMTTNTTTTLQTDIDFTQKQLEHMRCVDDFCGEMCECAGCMDGREKIPTKWEILPMETIDEILSNIDYSKYDNYQDWKSLVIACANQADTWTKSFLIQKSLLYNAIKYPSYKKEYLKETYFLVDSICRNNYQGKRQGKILKVNTLWKYLMESNREKWIELAFHKERPIDSELFENLTTVEGFKVFNEHFAYVSAGNSSFYVEWDGYKGDFVMYKKASLIENYEELTTTDIVERDGVKVKVKSQDFIKKYIKNPRKVKMRGQTFAPPPMKPRHNEYNFYRGFDADKSKKDWDIVNSLSKEQLEDELDFLLNHLKILSGEDDMKKCYEYNLKFYAHLLKYPAKLPRVMIIYKSKQGVGKNQWLRFISNIIGKTYYSSSEKIEQFVGTFNWSIAYKLLININELKQGKKFNEQLKTIIADDYINARKLFHDILELKNFTRYVGATNQDVYITIETSDRRYAIFACNNKYVLLPFGSEERSKYFNTLALMVENTYLQKCFLRYCREFVDVDIDYDFEGNRPITTEYKKVKLQNQPISHKFYQWLYELDLCKVEYTKRELFDIWNSFLSNCREKYEVSSQTFITNYLENHCLPNPNEENITEDYLENNADKFIYKSNQNRKQYYYRIDIGRLESFFERNLYQVDKPTPMKHNDSDSD